MIVIPMLYLHPQKKSKDKSSVKKVAKKTTKSSVKKAVVKKGTTDKVVNKRKRMITAQKNTDAKIAAQEITDAKIAAQENTDADDIDYEEAAADNDVSAISVKKPRSARPPHKPELSSQAVSYKCHGSKSSRPPGTVPVLVSKDAWSIPVEEDPRIFELDSGNVCFNFFDIDHCFGYILTFYMLFISY
jgi:hypothetical protein